MDNSIKDKIDYQLRVAHLLKTIRMKNNWGQKQLATELNCSLSYIERLESKTNPDNILVNSFLELKKYASLNNLSATEFIAYIEGFTIKKDPIFNEVIEKILKMDIEDQADLILAFKKHSPRKILKAFAILELFEGKGKSNFFSTLDEFIKKLGDIING